MDDTAFLDPADLSYVFLRGSRSCHLGISVYFRDVLHLYSVLTLAWMYVTPIFYPFEMLPHKAQLIVRLNPMFQYINFFRCVTIYNIVPDIYSWIAIIGWSALSVMLGMIIFSKLQRGFIFYL